MFYWKGEEMKVNKSAGSTNPNKYFRSYSTDKIISKNWVTMVTSLPTKSIPLLTLERSFYLYSRATLSRTGKMIPLEFVKGILTEFKKYKISSKALDFVFFVIPQVLVVVVVLPYITRSFQGGSEPVSENVTVVTVWCYLAAV